MKIKKILLSTLVFAVAAIVCALTVGAEKAGDYQLIVEKYKIFNWKEYFDIVDYLDEHDISYIVYA